MLARLSLIDGDAQPAVVDLTPDQPISIGRSRDNNVVLPRDEQASRLHARLYYEHGRWLIRDFGLNGTRIDNSRINQVAELNSGNEIQIGFARFRFLVPDESAKVTKLIGKETVTTNGEVASYPSTKLDAKALSAFVQMTMGAIDARDVHDLARQVINNVFYHTGASIVGWFNLDASAPLARAVWPENATVDDALSRMLTRRVVRDTRTIWLAEDTATLATMCLPGGYQDAIALPLKVNGEAVAALHLAKSGGYFCEKDRLYVEAVAAFAGPVLNRIRQAANLESVRRSNSFGLDELLGDSPAMVSFRNQLQQLAGNHTPVLLEGEPGTNPTAAAYEIHLRGTRRNGPFIIVPSLQEMGNQAEAELFGYRRGAFAGADRDHSGLIGAADGGTLFVEEISSLSRESQQRLLRLIQDKYYQPFGATYERRADVRLIVAATFPAESSEDPPDNRLGNRWAVLEPLGFHRVQLTALRDRRPDIGFLAQLYLDRLSLELGPLPVLTPSAVAALRDRHWPGNTRQLRAIIEAAATSGATSIDGPLIERLL